MKAKRCDKRCVDGLVLEWAFLACEEFKMGFGGGILELWIHGVWHPQATNTSQTSNWRDS